MTKTATDKFPGEGLVTSVPVCPVGNLFGSTEGCSLYGAQYPGLPVEARRPF